MSRKKRQKSTTSRSKPKTSRKQTKTMSARTPRNMLNESPEVAAKPKFSKWDPSVVLFGLDRGKVELINSISDFLRPNSGPVPADGTTSVKLNEYIMLEPAEDADAVPLTEYKAGTHTVLSNRDRQRFIKLYNCNSGVISQLADQKLDPDVARLREELRQEMRQADMLICAVTAADTDKDNIKTFGLFRDFVTQINIEKQRDREVGLYPVLIVVTECDELRKDAASNSDWLRRVEICKAKARAEFNEVFNREDARASDPSPEAIAGFGFGTIDLQVWGLSTTEAAKLGKDDVPVVLSPKQLFSEACSFAESYRARMLRTRKRLRLTLSAAGVMVSSMFLGALMLISYGGLSASDILADRVRTYQQNERPPEERYSDQKLPLTRRELTQIQKSAGFDELPEELRQYVLNRDDEVEAYDDYREQFYPPRLGPADVRTLKQLQQLEGELDTTLEPPQEYAKEWEQTDAVKLWKKWKLDEKLLREAESQLNDYYRGLIRRANQLLLVETTPDYNWRVKVSELLREASNPPYARKDTVPGSVQLPLLRGKPLTYDSAYKFDRVEQAFYDWRDTQNKLAHLRQFCDVLGLTRDPELPPLLDLPEPGNGVSTEKLAQARLAELNQRLPTQTERAYSDWVIDQFPDPVRKILNRELEERIATGSRHVVQWISKQQENVDLRTKAGRESFADRLVNDSVVQDWGRLLQLLQRCRGVAMDEANPVTELVAFLRRDVFPIDLPSLELTLPDDLRTRRTEPSSSLTIEYTPQGGNPQQFKYKQEGNRRPDRPVTHYTFVPENRAAVFDYKPGDRLTAQLEIRSGAERFDLIWASEPNALYQFKGLARPPIMKRSGPISAEESAPGVQLELNEMGQLPRLPRLYPRLATQ